MMLNTRYNLIVNYFSVVRFSFHKIVLGMASVLMMLSCSHREKTAKNYLSEAESAYQQGNYSLAKLKIDSIKIVHPKAFDEINSGFSLMQEVRMAENKRNIVFCDSMLRIHYAKLSELLPKFDYVRDNRYQEFGEYYPKAYPHQSSLSRNGLRSGVSEKGILSVESVLAGTAIKHHQIKVSSRDGSFAESLSVTSDGLNYRFNTLDNTYEIVRYAGNDENGVAQFIHTFQDEPLTVHFIGNRTITATLTDASKKGIVQSFELSTLLKDIEQLKFEKEKSEVLIRYLESK